MAGPLQSFQRLVLRACGFRDFGFHLEEHMDWGAGSMKQASAHGRYVDRNANRLVFEANRLVRLNGAPYAPKP